MQRSVHGEDSAVKTEALCDGDRQVLAPRIFYRKESRLLMWSSVHLLPAVAIHFVAFSGKSFILPFSYGAFIKASLEITSPSYRFHIPICSMVLQKQQIKNVKHPPFIYLITEATICIAMFLFQTLKILIFFTQFLLTHHRELLSPLQKFKNMNFD